MPDKTAETIVDGWLHTGDLGLFDERGYLFLRDRVREVVITGGFNVYPSDVETVLSEHPAVAECAIVGIPDDHWGEAVHAAVEIKSGAATDLDEIKLFLKQRLGSGKDAEEIHVFPVLPKSAVGKVLKTVIKQQILNEDLGQLEGYWSPTCTVCRRTSRPLSTMRCVPRRCWRLRPRNRPSRVRAAARSTSRANTVRLSTVSSWSIVPACAHHQQVAEAANLAVELLELIVRHRRGVPTNIRPASIYCSTVASDGSGCPLRILCRFAFGPALIMRRISSTGTESWAYCGIVDRAAWTYRNSPSSWRRAGMLRRAIQRQ